MNNKFIWLDILLVYQYVYYWMMKMCYLLIDSDDFVWPNIKSKNNNIQDIGKCLVLTIS